MSRRDLDWIYLVSARKASRGGGMQRKRAMQAQLRVYEGRIEALGRRGRDGA